MLLLNWFLDGGDLGVISRSGRVIKKSTKLLNFTSPDDIEAKKAKKVAAASRKLMVMKLTIIIILIQLINWFIG